MSAGVVEPPEVEPAPPVVVPVLAPVVEPVPVFVPPAVEPVPVFTAPVPPAVEPDEPPPDTTGLPVILSINSFVPAPIAAPVSAFTILLVVEFELPVVGLTVGFTTEVGLVVLVVGVVDVLVVTVGFVVGVVFDVSVVLGVAVVLGVVVVLAVVEVFGAKVVLGVEVVFVVSVGLVVAGLLNTDVNGRPEVPAEPADLTALEPPEPPAEVIEDEPRPDRLGVSSTPRMMLPSGARSSPLASGSCLLDVRFFRIAMFYPVFFTSDVKPAMLVTGLNFVVLAKVLGGAALRTGAAFCIGINFDTSMRGGGVGTRGAGRALATCKPPAGRTGARGAGRLG